MRTCLRLRSPLGCANVAAMPPTGLRLCPLSGTRADHEAMQEVLESAPHYYDLLLAGPPGPAEATSLFLMLPEGWSYEDKFVFGIKLDDRWVGTADLLRGWPDPGTAMLGLLLVGEPWQGRGIGSWAFEQLLGIVRSWPACHQLRVAVLASNGSALAFWKSHGFTENGEVKPYHAGSVTGELIVLTRPL